MLHQSKFTIFFIMATIFLLGMGVDIYTPSLPTVAHYFSVDSSTVKLSVFIYIVGYGVFQLVAGTLSDSWGRRKILLTCLILYCISAILIPFSPNITVLLLLRLLQGIAVSGPAVIARAMVTDIFPHEDIPKVSSYVVIAWGLGPVVAPFIGGYLAEWFGWQSTFYFLAIYAFIVFLMYLRFPETLKNKQVFSVKKLKANFAEVLTHPMFIGGIFCLGLLYGMLLTFNVMGPFLVEKSFGYSVVSFGRVALMMGLGWFLGGLTNRLLVKRAKPKRVICIVYPLLFLAALVMCVLALCGIYNLWVTIIPTFFAFLFGGLMFPNILSVCLRLFPHIGGTASAIMGAFFVTGSGLISLIASYLPEVTQLNLSLMNLILIILTGLFYVCLIHKKL